MKELSYRKPNLLEMYDFLDKIGGFGEQNVFKLKASCLRAMEPFVNFKECGFETYDDLLNDTENRGLELSKLADKFYSDIIGVFAKKS